MSTVQLPVSSRSTLPSTRFHSWPASLTLFAIATVGEFVALSGWFVLHRANPPISSTFYDAGDWIVRLLRGVPADFPFLAAAFHRIGDFLQSPHFIAAVLVLWAGFIVERWMVVLWLDVPRRIITPAGHLRPRLLVLGGVTLAEIVVWVVWIAVAERNELAFAAAVLVTGIHLVHSYEVALIKHRTFRSVVVGPDVMVITLLEAVGGVTAFWLATKGMILFPLAAIGGALLLEHILQVTALKKEAESGL